MRVVGIRNGWYALSPAGRRALTGYDTHADATKDSEFRRVAGIDRREARVLRALTATTLSVEGVQLRTGLTNLVLRDVMDRLFGAGMVWRG